MDDIDVLRQMYATLCSGTDIALTLLEEGNIWTAREVLQKAMYDAEDLCIRSILANDELALRRPH